MKKMRSKRLQIAMLSHKTLIFSIKGKLISNGSLNTFSRQRIHKQQQNNFWIPFKYLEHYIALRVGDQYGNVEEAEIIYTIFHQNLSSSSGVGT
jgi:hypothetical protein